MLYRPLKGAISSLKRCYINSTTLYFQGFTGGLKLLKLIKTNKKAKSQKNLWITQFFAMRFCLFFIFLKRQKKKSLSKALTLVLLFVLVLGSNLVILLNAVSFIIVAKGVTFANGQITNPMQNNAVFGLL